MVEENKELATPSQWLANVDETNVLDMLDQDALEWKTTGMTTLKVKEVWEKDNKKLILEIKNGDQKKEVKEIKNARIILWTDQYQISDKVGKGFKTTYTSSEVYQNKNENIYMFDHEVKSYLKLENLKEFSDRRKEKLTKNEKMQRMKIVYIDTDEGILKTYLRPSQYVGCLEDKWGYRYSNPLEGTFGDIEKKVPVKRYNNTFTIKPASYEKGQFLVTYPEFTAKKADDADPIKVAGIVKDILGGILSQEHERINGWERRDALGEDTSDDLPI